MNWVQYHSDTINSENIDDFLNFVEKLPRGTTVSGINISDDVNLEEFFNPKYMSRENREMMEISLGYSLASKCSAKHFEELFNMTDAHPLLFTTTMERASHYSGSLYQRMSDELDKRPINLTLYDSTIKNHELFSNCMHGVLGNKEEIKHLSENQVVAVSNIFKNYANNSFYAIKDKLLNSEVLLNCDNLPEEVRKEVNNYAINNGYYKLDSQFMDKTFFNKLFKANKTPISKKESSPEYRKFYLSVRDKLIGDAEKVSFDPYNGKRPISQCLKNQIKEITGLDGFEKINKDSVFYDAYVHAAQKDIREGNADKLDKDAIEAALSQDKDNYYIRKIPASKLRETNINYNSEQSQFVGAARLEKGEMDKESIISFSKDIEHSKTLTSEEKDKISKALDKKIEEMKPWLQEKKKSFESQQKYSELKENQTKSLSATKAIEEIQQIYGKILSSTKNNTPNKQENKVIDIQQVEKVISDVLEGKPVKLDYPQQKSLPLFGRKKEKQRREKLNRYINDFNQCLNNIKVNSEELKQYSGNILNTETLTKASQKETETRETAQQFYAQESSTWLPGLSKDDIQKDEKFIADLEQSRDKIHKRINDIKNLAKENISVKGEKIEDVSHLSGEEKRNARAANKAKGVDKLAEKEKISKENKGNLFALRAKQLKDRL